MMEPLSLIPGKGFPIVEGEVIFCQMYDWGAFGQIKNKSGLYNFKLTKENTAIIELPLGVDLVIKNGFCIQKEGKDLLVMDGKYGYSYIKINRENYEKWQNDANFFVYTGIVKKIIIYNDIIELVLRNAISKKNKYKKITVSKNSWEKQRLEEINTLENKIIKIEGHMKNGIVDNCSIELLPEKHFICLLNCLKNGEFHNLIYFNSILSHIIQLVSETSIIIKDLLFLYEKDITKTTIDGIKKTLMEKICSSEYSIFDILLMPSYIIQNYFLNLTAFCEKYLNENEKNRLSGEDFLLMIEQFYPKIKLDKIAFTK